MEIEHLDDVEKGRILVEALWKPRGGVVLEEASTEEPPAVCVACGTTDGWVWTDDPTPECPVGRLVPCAFCLGPQLQQKALDRLYAEIDMPAEYQGKTLESYALLRDADLEAMARVQEIRVGGPQTAYFYGKTGVGKTFFAWHLVSQWMADGGTVVLFVTELELLDRIRAGYGEHVIATAQEVFEATKRARLLVVDDLGSTEKVTPWVVQELFGLVDFREKHHLPTLYTSNVPIDGLEETLGPRTVSRLRKHCGKNVIWVDGIDQRRVQP